ncbi:uncharacterized protein si:dkey-22i16.9 [Danio aesculapii]|uniref:uncharacterized protein si:dkey-22i16.9 n=1 Tax=Danio aesculapii TaxID=1142201 RepID=UPI0024C0452C|nr:uncharacterized protein si:dkey-22i16.9 [Danio aesculapii]
MTPFGITWRTSGFWFWFLATFPSGLSQHVAVKVKDTAVLSCSGTCNRILTWTFKTENEDLDVLKCVQETCTEGHSFKDRVNLVHAKNQPGKLSLMLNSVLYNDEGWYVVKCDSVFLCRFRLEAFVPTTINTTVRGNAKLPCYARTEKQISDETVNILWKKDDQVVFQVLNGNKIYGPRFPDRASVSLNDYKDGDLSLTIHNATKSDAGLYQCYHKPSEEHGHPGAVTLHVTAHEIFWTKKFGENLPLHLFGSDVTISFIGSDESEKQVCTVMGNSPTCSSDYINRVSVINDTLVLSGLTSADEGIFTVKDKMDEVIAVNTVTVEDADKRFRVSLFVYAVFILSCIGLGFLYKFYRTSPVTDDDNVGDSTVNMDDLRQPAYTRVPEQETSPQILECEVRPHTPVEETMTEPERCTKKLNNTEEEESIGQIDTEISNPLNDQS